MSRPLRALVGALLLAACGGPASAVTIDWITVGDPGNPADDNGYGSVATAYRISATEVTNAQYAEFLNAKAASDPYELYHTNMASLSFSGGITRSGSPGSYSYSTIGGREDLPVNLVSFYDALRLANWLHNGQGDGDTETGAYTLTAEGIAANTIARNPGATIFIPSEDEWYKAAFFNGTDYFTYPAGTDMFPTCASPGPAPNTSNCDVAVQDFTPVGSYTGSPSPYGTFDQGGNAWEWNEAVISGVGRGQRGGAFDQSPVFQGSFLGTFGIATADFYNTGIRLAASVPEPGGAVLAVAGALGLAVLRARRARSQRS